MAAFLNFRVACNYNLKNTKTIRDKLNLINDITSQYVPRVSAMRYVRNRNNNN